MYLFSLYIRLLGATKYKRPIHLSQEGKLHINIKGKNGQLVVSWYVTWSFDTFVADTGDPWVWPCIKSENVLVYN